MDITINEGLLVLLVSRDDVDGTNIVPMMRQAQLTIRSQFFLTKEQLNVKHPVDMVDDLLITATLNGNRDIFVSA